MRHLYRDRDFGHIAHPYCRAPVCGESRWARERTSAPQARVRFRPRVRIPVPGEVLARSERLAADGAREQLLASVHSLVFVQASRLRKRLPALRAHVRPFSCVGPPMSTEIYRESESFSAVGAH